MFEEYWGLKEQPFENNNDLRFLYRSFEVEQLLTRISNWLYGKKSFFLLMGNEGVGKTYMSKLLIQQFESEGLKVIPVSVQSYFSGRQFLQNLIKQIQKSDYHSEDFNEVLSIFNNILKTQKEKTEYLLF